jgi:predicted DsbA family dithiol-disulfide isomerase
MSRLIQMIGVLLFLPCLSVGAKSPAIDWSRVPDIKAGDFKSDFLNKVALKLTKTPCYGRCSESIADCLSKNPIHTSAQRLARDVFLLMANEASDEDIGKWVEMRRKMAHPEPIDIRGIRLEGLTPLGQPKARVVVVEYSDFECPFCAMISPILEKVVKDSDGKANLYFKQFPIKGHARALPAARACVAADGFGKFWEYCPALFRNQADLSDEVLLKLAGDAGMDKANFKKRMQSEQTLDRIADEKMEGLKNRVQGTPTIYINGKEFSAHPTPELLRDRIEEELDILDGKD